VADSLLFQLIGHQFEDYFSLQLSSVAFFFLCAFEMLLRKRRLSFKLAPDQITDMFYWLLTPQVRVVSRVIAVLLIVGLALLLGVRLDAARLEGFGPVAAQPKLLIVAELFVLMDLATYWTHRVFHAVPFLWRFHSLHHSPTRVGWSTTGRVHPVNEAANYLASVVPFALLGFPITLMLPVAPIVIAFALAAHADWDTDYGPFSGILVSPRFHHWHHTHSHEGGNKNFANVFALWDRLFGSYYLPADRLPERFGLDVDDVPQGFIGQLLYPWRRRSAPEQSPPLAREASPRASVHDLEQIRELGPGRES
jgi:sterol desaturase/sphingolipid hydroxylase (fatty acid hydroxylase superfamily)